MLSQPQEHRPDLAQIVIDDGRAAIEPEGLDQLPEPDTREPRILAQQGMDLVLNGSSFDGRPGTSSETLIERWNGTRWKVQPSPNPGGSSDHLFGVAATSATNAWAVGDYYNGTTDHILALHCCWRRLDKTAP